MYTYQNGLSKFVPIAPNTMDKDFDNTHKKYNYKAVFSGAQTASIAKRNARERNRVKQVNDGFNALRKKLPAAIIDTLSGGARRGSGKKLSKVDTLRMVVEYIRHMEQILDDSDSAYSVTKTENTSNYSMDEGVFTECDSPNPESVPSPATSDSYSAASCYSEQDYSTSNYSAIDPNIMTSEYFSLLW